MERACSVILDAGLAISVAPPQSPSPLLLLLTCAPIQVTFSALMQATPSLCTPLCRRYCTSSCSRSAGSCRGRGTVQPCARKHTKPLHSHHTSLAVFVRRHVLRCAQRTGCKNSCTRESRSRHAPCFRYLPIIVPAGFDAKRLLVHSHARKTQSTQMILLLRCNTWSCGNAAG